MSLLLIGLLVRYDDERLLSASSSADAAASPFVISIQQAGISGLPSVMNVVIMIAVLSVGNSSIYGSTRTLAALAEQRQAPRFLAYIDRKGRPIFAIIIASAVGYLSYLAASNKQGEAFTWMLALSGLSSIFTWGSICFAHIRFRAGWKYQGHSLDELAFRSQPGYWGSVVGFGFNILVLIAQFWTGFAPVGYGAMTASERVSNFFQAYLAAPIVILFYVSYKIYYRTPFMTVDKMDMRSGRRDLDMGQLLAEERAERAAWPVWKKVYKIFC